MDINDIRSLVTVFLFVVFIGIVLWAFSSRRKQDFEEAALLALDDDGTALDLSVASPKTERK